MLAACGPMDCFLSCSMPQIPASMMNQAARTLFLAALGCFAAFHFVSFYIIQNQSFASEDFTGWKIWKGLVADAFRHSSRVDAKEMIAYSGFLTSALLLVSSPFLVPFLRISRLAWWICVLTSGASMLGFGSVIIPQATISPDVVPGPGFCFLLAAMTLNFLGFFFIRREIPPNPVIDPS
jgi:hypothetical protein